MFKKVTVIGDGSMATVCALLLHSQEVEVTLWGPFPDRMEDLAQTRDNSRYLPDHPIPREIDCTGDEARATDHPELILNAIPTQYIRETWNRLAPHVKPDIPIVSVAKGIETETMFRPTQIIGDALQQHGPDSPDGPARPLAALSGPSVADELARCLPATVCAASDDEQLARRLQLTFTTQWFRVYTNTDLVGVELAGATKNVIALAAGCLDGLQAGNNAKSALLARGLAEITRLGEAMGAKAETFFGLTGVGDLATTCFSPTGRNRTCGEMLGKGQKLEECLDAIPGIVEGVPTTKAVVRLAEKHHVDMPITQSVHQVLFEGLDPLQAITQLMTRELKPERVG